eukprot:383936-Amphidinium_carterae.1
MFWELLDSNHPHKREARSLDWTCNDLLGVLSLLFGWSCLLVAVAGCCLLLVVAAVAGWLLLMLVTAAGLPLLVVTTTAGCCW